MGRCIKLAQKTADISEDVHGCGSDFQVGIVDGRDQLNDHASDEIEDLWKVRAISESAQGSHESFDQV